MSGLEVVTAVRFTEFRHDIKSLFLSSPRYKGQIFSFACKQTLTEP